MSTNDTPGLANTAESLADMAAAFCSSVAGVGNSNIAGDPSLLDAAAVIAISGVVAYIAGWWWLYNFMKNFNLHQLSLDIPREYYLVYTQRVVAEYWYIVLPAVATACIICYWFLTFSKGWVSLPVISTVFIGGALLFFYLSKRAANKFFEKMQRRNFERYPCVKVHLHQEDEKHIDRLYGEDLSAGHFRYLFEVGDRLLLFRVIEPTKPETSPLEVLNIRAPAVRALRFCTPADAGKTEAATKTN